MLFGERRKAAARIAPNDEVKGESTRQPGAAADVRRSGGGGGIRTRVRTYLLAGIYDAYPALKCRTRREETEKPPGTRPEKSPR